MGVKMGIEWGGGGGDSALFKASVFMALHTFFYVYASLKFFLVCARNSWSFSRRSSYSEILRKVKFVINNIYVFSEC